jgi:DNA-directed RNA polymerase specialized sigma24 family protein
VLTLQLALLYARYARLVYGVALSMLRSRIEAEDLVHNVFLAVLKVGLGPG